MVYYIVNGRKVDAWGNPVNGAGSEQSGPVPVQHESLNIPGVNLEQMQELQGAGYDTADALDSASNDDLLDVLTIGPAAVRHIRKWLDS